MKQQTQLEGKVRRWVDAGVIDAAAGERVLAFEAKQEHTATLRWPVYLAMAFGGILFAAGITLFVAAHWAEMSPGARFSVVLLMVGVLHGGGAALVERFPALSTTLRALGTASLGAGIFLAGQIFNLHENWATGILLWAIGAAVGVALLRDWVQVSFLALLLPTWLVSQWFLTTEAYYGTSGPVAFGLVMTALTYLSARVGDQASYARRTLVWVGGLALLPCVAFAVFVSMEQGMDYGHAGHPSLPASVLGLGWLIAIAAPLLVAYLLRGRAAWSNAVWMVWTYALILAAKAAHYRTYSSNRFVRGLVPMLSLYFACAVGAVGLVAWGLHEKRKERVNLGVAGFAISVLSFYFDSFMDKLGRSVSLLALGVLCLAGGYALEMARRKLMARMEQSA